MGSLKNNKKLYEYLKLNYTTTSYLFQKIFGHLFVYKKLDLKAISHLKLFGIEDLSGIEELSELQCVEIKGAGDLSPLEKCPNLHKISVNLPEQSIDIELLVRLSKKDEMQFCEFSGRGVKLINSKQALNFSDITTISYDGIAKFNPQQFSQVQTRLTEIQSLIEPEMSEFEIVETIYRNLLPRDFQYDYNNHSNGTNGYLVNNTMYGPLVEGKGVCSGIASALETALKNAGLDAISCGGWATTKPSAGYSHQWNQVKVDGEWYNLDLTNDFDKDPWEFFLKSDSNSHWAKYHCTDKEDKYETIYECSSTKYDKAHQKSFRQDEIKKLQFQKKQLLETQTNLKESNSFGQEVEETHIIKR